MKPATILTALALVATSVQAAPVHTYALAAVTNSRADGLQGPAQGILLGAVFQLKAVDLIAEASWADTPKIDTGDGQTLSGSLAIRLPAGPWYGQVGYRWARLDTSLYSKTSVAPRFEIGRGIRSGLWLSAHWRLPDETFNRSESYGVVLTWRWGEIYQRFLVEELRHTTGSGLRLGWMIGWAWKTDGS